MGRRCFKQRRGHLPQHGAHAAQRQFPLRHGARSGAFEQRRRPLRRRRRHGAQGGEFFLRQRGAARDIEPQHHRRHAAFQHNIGCLGVEKKVVLGNRRAVAAPQRAARYRDVVDFFLAIRARKQQQGHACERPRHQKRDGGFALRKNLNLQVERRLPRRGFTLFRRAGLPQFGIAGQGPHERLRRARRHRGVHAHVGQQTAQLLRGVRRRFTACRRGDAGQRKRRTLQRQQRRGALVKAAVNQNGAFCQRTSLLWTSAAGGRTAPPRGRWF